MSEWKWLEDIIEPGCMECSECGNTVSYTDVPKLIACIREMREALEHYSDRLPGQCTHEMPKGQGCTVMHYGPPNKAMKTLARCAEGKFDV